MDNEVVIHILGIGSLGSNLAHLLVRLGFDNIVLYDFDDIGPNNLTNQFYFNEQIGTPKQDALVKNLKQINPDAQISLEGKYEHQYLYDIVFLCLDSIEERKRIAELNKNNFNISLISDMRLGLGEGQCFTAHFENFNKLISTMQFKNDESTTPMNACGSTMRILPTVQIITSLAVTNLIDFLRNDTYHQLIAIDSIEGISKKLMKIEI